MIKLVRILHDEDILTKLCVLRLEQIMKTQFRLKLVKLLFSVVRSHCYSDVYDTIAYVTCIYSASNFVNIFHVRSTNIETEHTESLIPFSPNIFLQ